MLHHPEAQRKSLIGPTYGVMVVMLIIGQIQVSAIMEIKGLKDFLATRYFFSLIQFFVSFLSIQLYGFFYHILATKPTWVRILAGLWTYEVNTLSIMKPAKRAPHFSLIVSVIFTYLILIISVIYGNVSTGHKRGLFTSRHKLILWSERLFVLTCFGIIVSSETKRVVLEFPTLLVYTMMSNVFVIIFAASIRRPNFYQKSRGDYILIGQLYYLNFFALYMSFVWMTASFLELMGWDVVLSDIPKLFQYSKHP